MSGPHPPEGGAEAVRLAASGLARRAVAARVGVSQTTVSKWVRAARAEGGEPDPLDWGAWSEWHDQREPDRDGDGWREWFDERPCRLNPATARLAARLPL